MRASDPKAPATLLIELLRAYIPEEFSRNGHKCDNSRSQEQSRRYRRNASRERKAGYPSLRKIAEGAENADPQDDWPSNSHLSPTGEETQRGGPSHPTPYTHEPSNATRHTGEGTSPRTPIRGRYPKEVPPPSHPSEQDRHIPSASSAPSAVKPSRAERREQQLRKQRKAPKRKTPSP